MRRQIFSGYPCPEAPWKTLMPPADAQSFVTFADVLQSVGKPDFQLLATETAKRIMEFNPDSIVCHDYAVTYTLLALLKLRKKSRSPRAKLTIFNGAFRGFDVFQAPHPIRAQFVRWDRLVKEVLTHGGEVDPRFKNLNHLVKALYRQIILFNLKEKFTALFFRHQPLGWNLGVEAQIIASTDDFYIPFKCLELIRDDFNIKEFHTLQYGHFPYSKNTDQVRAMIMAFESK